MVFIPNHPVYHMPRAKSSQNVRKTGQNRDFPTPPPRQNYWKYSMKFVLDYLEQKNSMSEYIAHGVGFIANIKREIAFSGKR
jgi:hypothetical protein